MKSKISFFNRGLFRSALRRFWPLWALHFAGWFLFMPMMTLVNSLNKLSSSEGFVFHLLESGCDAARFAAFIMAALTAMAVFGFMYSNRSAGLIASLPIRREAVFGSAWLGGMVPVIASNLLVALLTFLFALGGGTETMLLLKAVVTWFAIYSMQFTLFFGIACVISVMTGSIVAMPILYIIFNFLAVGMEAVVRMYFASLVWGMNYTFGCILDILSPLVYFVSNNGPDFTFIQIPVEESFGYTVSKCTAVSYELWLPLVIYFVVGLLLTAAALLAFRKRRMEAAGDVIAITRLKPLFKYGVAACAALCGGLLLFVMISALFGSGPSLAVFIMIPSMILFAFVGYFGAKMLLHKSFHVFRGSWTGFVTLCLGCAAFALLCDVDVFNIGCYVPDADDVSSMYVYTGGRIQSRAAIEEFIAFQKELVSEKDKYENLNYDDADSTSIVFDYTLKNGKRITREYTVRHGDENYVKYYTLSNLPQVLKERFTPKFPVDNVHVIYSALCFSYKDDTIQLTPAQAIDYYNKALMADIDSGRKVLWNDPCVVLATIIIDVADDPNANNSDQDEVVIDITESCTASIQWVKDVLGIDLTSPEYSSPGYDDDMGVTVMH